MSASDLHLEFTDADDGYHQPSDDPYETETNLWSFNIPERKIGCSIHAPYYPNRKTVTRHIFAWNDEGYDPGRLACYKRVEEAPMRDNPNLRDTTFPGSAHMQVDLGDALGRTMEIEGFAISRMSELGYGVNQLMRWDFDGKIGWGEDQDVWNGPHIVRMLDALRVSS